MKIGKSTCIQSWLCAGTISLALLLSGTVAAQPTEDQDNDGESGIEETLEEIVVTGSRIKRTGYDTLETSIVNSGEDIDIRGYINVADSLEDTPGFGISDSSPVGTSQATLGIAQTFVDFFGLGSQRTLTLVNGRRFVSSNTASGSGAAAPPGSQVDLNLIPAGLVDRVETVAIGGAPIYGADAIAGTVNVILKDDYEGATFTAQYGMTEEGDAETQAYRALIGGNFDNDRGNVVIAAEYNQQDGMLLSERFPFRQISANPANTGPDDGIPSQRVYSDVIFSVLTEGGLPYANYLVPLAGLDLPGIVFPPIYDRPNYIYDASGTPLQFGADGRLTPYTAGAAYVSALGSPILSEGGDGVNPADHFSLLSPTERTLFNGLGHYDLTDTVRVFLETSYARTEGEELSELYQFAAPAALGGPILTFSANNPYLNADDRATILANGLETFNLNRNLNDVVDSDPGRTTLDVYRVVGGLQGDFLAGGQSFGWDVSYNYGRSESISGLNYINPDRLLLAIDAVTDPSTGNIVCASGGDCVPMNLFGVNNFSSEAADYVSDRGQAISVNTQKVLTGNLNGEFPIGLAEPVGFNVGYEHREESAEFNPDATLEAGILLLGAGVNGFEGVEGGFETDEFYGEVLVPLISPEQDLALIQALSLEGAARYVDNSLAGGDTTWSLGSRLAPQMPEWGDGLVLRGVYTHSIRAPAITELFLGSTPIATGIADPCNAQNYNQGPAASVREANCRAALNAVGAPTPDQFANTTGNVSAFGTRSGNPDLANEVADSWSVGFVFQPTAWPSFRVSADWSDVSLEDGIQTLGLNALLATCYDSTDFPSEAACAAFTRLTAAEAAAQPGATRVVGDVANGYRTGFYNTSTLDFSGLIVAAEYVHDFEGSTSSQLLFGARLFRVNEFETVIQAGAPANDSVGELGTPENRLNLTTAYRRNVFDRALDLNLQALWTDSVVADNDGTTELFPANVLFIDDYWRFDATASYQVTDLVRAQLSVSNLLDTSVPYGAQVLNSFGLYDPFGRSYQFRLIVEL